MSVYGLYERIVKSVAGERDEVAAIGTASRQNLVDKIDGVPFFRNVRRQLYEGVLLQMLFKCDDGFIRINQFCCSGDHAVLHPLYV